MRAMSRYRIRSRPTSSTRMAVDILIYSINNTCDQKIVRKAGVYNLERQAEYAGRLFTGRDVARTINRYAILLVFSLTRH